MTQATTMDPVSLPVQRTTRSFRARLLRCGVLSVIFGAGAVAGYCVGTMQLIQTETPSSDFVKQQDKFTEFVLARLKKDLSLTDTQYPQVEMIVRRHHEAFDELRRKTQPLFAKEMASMDRDMIAVLSEEQVKLWKSRMERMRNPWHRPSGGGNRDKNGKKGPDNKSDGKQSPASGDKAAESSPAAPEVIAKPKPAA